MRFSSSISFRIQDPTPTLFVIISSRKNEVSSELLKCWSKKLGSFDRVSKMTSNRYIDEGEISLVVPTAEWERYMHRHLHHGAVEGNKLMKGVILFSAHELSTVGNFQTGFPAFCFCLETIDYYFETIFGWMVFLLPRRYQPTWEKDHPLFVHSSFIVFIRFSNLPTIFHAFQPVVIILVFRNLTSHRIENLIEFCQKIFGDFIIFFFFLVDALAHFELKLNSCQAF